MTAPRNEPNEPNEPNEKDTGRGPVSETDASTLGFVDTLKRRKVSPPRTQREEDVAQAEARGEWAPTEEEHAAWSESGPKDATGVNAEGVIDESMRYMRRG